MNSVDASKEKNLQNIAATSNNTNSVSNSNNKNNAVNSQQNDDEDSDSFTFTLAEQPFESSSSWNWRSVFVGGVIPSARHCHTSVVYKNKMYIFGGYSNDSVSGIHRNDFFEFDFGKQNEFQSINMLEESKISCKFFLVLFYFMPFPFQNLDLR